MLTHKPRLFFIAILVLFASAAPLVVHAAILQPGQSSAQIEVGLSSSEAGDDTYNAYLPIIQTSLCEEIRTDTTWGISGSPYHITCDVIVPAGVTLTIEEGIVVQFAHPEDDLIISGTLQTVGTESAPITFQPLSGMTSIWGQVAFMAGSSGALDHTLLEYGGSSDGMVYIASGAVQVLNSIVQYSANTGIYIHDASPLISGTQILSNTIPRSNGGGLRNDTGSPIIQNNTFAGNTAEAGYAQTSYGGGLYNISGSPLIQNNTFINNVAGGFFGSGGGGGLYNDSGNPVIQNNAFIDNGSGGYSGRGGGLDSGGSPIIQNNTFIGNETGGKSAFGGGLSCSGCAIIQNNTFIGNVASGNAASGGGMSCSGCAIIRNNIVINNEIIGFDAPGGGGISTGSSVTLTLDYNDVWNNTGGDYSGVEPGPHDISIDPLLVDPTHGDFHLSAGSPCIDAGDPVNYPTTDFEGDVRPQGLAPDIGADEFLGSLVIGWRWGDVFARRTPWLFHTW